MIQAKQDLLAALGEAIQELSPGADLAAAFESPKQASHGDFACTAAMQLARPLKKNPRELAQGLIEALQRRAAFQTWVDSLEIAGPGFINIRLKAAAKQAVVKEVLEAGAAFGSQTANGQHVMVEFVSANPTGPLHLGHARQAALGDSICSLFATQGWDVTREFYYNDAGVQIATLANSTLNHKKLNKPKDLPLDGGAGAGHGKGAAWARAQRESPG
jgi:arginyl-tRNA synthetase